VVIAPPDGSMQQYLDSLELLHHYPIRAIAPGHGSIIEEPTRAIDSLIRHRLQRELKSLRHLRDLSADADVSLDTLLSRVYSDVPQSLHPIARYSLLAHLLKLEKDGVVTSPDSLRWRAVTGD
jgi:glyoxylase-like metal-dependent hydrolase (beta-lactamase superfamily II)